MPTPHNSAKKGDFAKTVLMPGDPLRAKFIAETFLDEPKLVNNVRGVQGYTGTYKGVPVSVMASGMGMPSIGIYSYELFTQYDVESIIRVGSAGALQKDLKLGDVVAGMGACTNSNYAAQYGLGGTFAPIADFQLLSAAVESAKELGVRMDVGNLYSSDTFYDASNPSLKWADMGVLAIEMEAAALYCNAAYTKKRGLSLCSISDNILTGEDIVGDRAEGKSALFRIGGVAVEGGGLHLDGEHAHVRPLERRVRRVVERVGRVEVADVHADAELLRRFNGGGEQLKVRDGGKCAAKAVLRGVVRVGARTHARDHVTELQVLLQRARRTHSDDALDIVLREQLVGVDTDGRHPHAAGHHADGNALVGACVALHAADVVDELWFI